MENTLIIEDLTFPIKRKKIKNVHIRIRVGKSNLLIELSAPEEATEKNLRSYITSFIPDLKKAIKDIRSLAHTPAIAKPENAPQLSVRSSGGFTNFVPAKGS